MFGHGNQEFLFKIQAEVREGRGSRVFDKAVGLGSLELQKVSSSLQEVGNLPTRVYFLYKYYFGLG